MRSAFVRTERLGAYVTGVGLGMLLGAALVRADEAAIQARVFATFASAMAPAEGPEAQS